MPSPVALKQVTIVDGYVDEPAHFGVPPYISTYPRYVAGALVDAGVPKSRITYYTIDQIREDRMRWRDIEGADLFIYLGGMTVPGKYVGGTPAEPEEVRRMGWVAKGSSMLGGPVKFGVGDRNQGAIETTRSGLDYDFVAKGDVEAAVYDHVTNGLNGFPDRMRTLEEGDRWSILGSFIVEHHPNHPEYLICELETSRGCPYRCSFCTEPLYGQPTFRDPKSVVQEVSGLYSHGIRHFRLGRQADILAYGGDGESPNPKALRDLYSGIREAAPELRTLHLDNMNPTTIVRWPERSKTAISIIARHNTAGDTAAFGLESADPVVQEENNLNISTDECFEAIRIVNEIGGIRGDGLPKILPGINLVHGLMGEREQTYDYNFEFLKRVYDAGLSIRRINIRQVMAFSGTGMSETGASIAINNKAMFKRYKQQVREEIDQPMLRRVAPTGTVLHDIHLEYHKNGRTFGRQVGSYPILVCLPEVRSLDSTVDGMIVDHGYRSVTAIPYPLDLNQATMSELTAIPGIGSHRAGQIISNRPFSSRGDLDEAVNIDDTALDHYSIGKPA